MEKLKGFIKDLIRDGKTEFGKITWPGKQQVWYSTLVVIIVTLVVAAYLGLVDVVLTGIITKIIG